MCDVLWVSMGSMSCRRRRLELREAQKKKRAEQKAYYLSIYIYTKLK